MAGASWRADGYRRLPFTHGSTTGGGSTTGLRDPAPADSQRGHLSSPKYGPEHGSEVFNSPTGLCFLPLRLVLGSR